jgi:hypothetical protein
MGYDPPDVNLEKLGEVGHMVWKRKGVARYDQGIQRMRIFDAKKL